MLASVQRLSDEMRIFKDEMRAFNEESRRATRALDRRLAEISDRQGKLLEDFVAPSVPVVLRQVLGRPEDAALTLFAVRMAKRHPTRSGEHRELDVLAVLDDVLFVVEVKSRLTPEHVTAFAERLPQVREFFPELANLAIIGGVASVYVDPSLLVHAERQGLIVMAAGGGLMESVNRPGFEPTRR